MPRFRRFPLPTGLLAMALLAGVLSIAAPAPVAAQGPFAELRVLAGQAEVTRKSRRLLLRQGQRMTVRYSDNIRTFEASKVYLRVVESSAEAVITANTRIRAGELTRDGKPRDLLTVLYGGLRMRVKRWLGTDKPVVAGVATIGIKGTDFVTLVKRKQTGYFMSDGDGDGDGEGGTAPGSGAGGAGAADQAAGSDAKRSMIRVTEFIGIEGTIEAVNQRRPEFRLTIGHRQWGEMLPDKPPAPPIRVPDEVWFTTLETFSFLP